MQSNLSVGIKSTELNKKQGCHSYSNYKSINHFNKNNKLKLIDQYLLSVK